MEKQVHEMTRSMGIGAQFGGKYFCHDVRVVRLPRHGASCPVGIGVSCSADRQINGKITSEGIFLEQLETQPAKYLPDVDPSELGGKVVKVLLLLYTKFSIIKLHYIEVTMSYSQYIKVHSNAS